MFYNLKLKNDICWKNKLFLCYHCNCKILSLSVDECVRLVSKSIRPVIILGSQSTLPPVPADQLRQALEVTQHSLCYYWFCFLHVACPKIHWRKHHLSIRILCYWINIVVQFLAINPFSATWVANHSTMFGSFLSTRRTSHMIIWCLYFAIRH